MDFSRQDNRPGGLRELHIGLLWHTLFNGNLGVGALSLANAELVASAAIKNGYTPVLHFMGSRGCMDYGFEVPYRYDFTNIGLAALMNPMSDLHRVMRRCDLILDIGGGDSFSDIYGARRYAQIILSKFAAGLSGGRLVLSPQTVGPFYKPYALPAAKTSLKPFVHAFARDEASFAILKEIYPADNASLSSDVAFALSYRKPEKNAGPSLDGRAIKIGLNISSLLYRLDEISHARVKLAVDYPRFVHTLLDQLCTDPRYEVHLVPHVIDSDNLDGSKEPNREDDYAVARNLKARYPGVVLAPAFASPTEAKSYIAGLDVFAGSRMHATIAAISSNVPVIPLGYSRKFNGLFGSVGYGWTIDLTTETTDQALARFVAALSELDRIRDDAVAANAEARKRLGRYEEFLDQMVASLPTSHA